MEYIDKTLKLQIEARENFIDKFNEIQLQKSLKELKAEEVTSLYVNYPPLLLRNKSE